jgi:Tfp pilus assembly protein PilZ
MADKRNLGRLRKRIPVRFGIGSPSRLAFTEDVSTTGIFIKTPNVCVPGSQVLVELALEPERKVLLEAEVIWAKKVRPEMINIVKKGGMGVRIVRFLNGETEFMQFCQEGAER